MQAGIVDAGHKILISLYDGKCDSTRDSFRYAQFCSKVALGTQFVQIHTLPPAFAAARYHILWSYSYLEVQRGIGRDDLNPEKWGWKIKDNKLQPITTDLPPAPAKLLKVICCNCKTDCDTKRCSCRKHGLDCSPACGECQGLHCSNSHQSITNSVPWQPKTYQLFKDFLLLPFCLIAMFTHVLLNTTFGLKLDVCIFSKIFQDLTSGIMIHNPIFKWRFYDCIRPTQGFYPCM